MSYISVDVDVEIDQIISAMSSDEKKELIDEMDLDSLREDLKNSELSPRQVVLLLRKYRVNLINLRKEINYYFPLKEG